MKRLAGCVLAALLVAQGAAAQEPDLAPLVPPKAPWLKKNQKKKKAVKKKPAAPQATESKPGAPYVAAPPALELPPLVPPKPDESAKPPVEAAKPPAATPPVEAAQPPAATAPVEAAKSPAATPPPEAALPLPPLVPLTPPAQATAPPVEATARPPTTVVAVPDAAITAAPPPSTPARRAWKKPTALAALGVGAAVAATGLYFGAKSHSDLSSAESAFHANGAYRATDIATLNSGNSAARTANVLFGVAGVLVAASAVVAFAF